MWYREWITIRYKFGLVQLLYTMLGFMLATFWNQSTTSDQARVAPLFENWIMYSPFLILGAAVLGGADLISNETDKSTLSFLLTRPLSRVRIYASKIVFSSLALATTYGLSSLVMLAVDAIPRQRNLIILVPNERGAAFVNAGQVTSVPVDLLYAFGSILLITLGGIGVLCLTGLVSIFARNIMQTFIFTAMVSGGLFFIYKETAEKWGISVSPSTFYHPESILMLALLVSVLAGIIFIVGIRAFCHKEF